MPVDPPQRPLLDGEPPFLREATRPIPGPPPGAMLIDRVQELSARWRIGVLSFVVPAVVVILAGFWVMAGGEPPPQEPTAAPAQDPSGLEAVVDGLAGLPDETGGGLGVVRTSTTGSTDASEDPALPPGVWGGPGGPVIDGGVVGGPGSDGEDGTGGAGGGDGAGGGTGSPAADTTTSAPVVEQPTTAAPAPPPTPSSTNPPPPASTAPPPPPPPPATTTTAPVVTVTEAPPPSLGLCVLTVRWRTTARAEPSADAEEVGQAGGWHGAIGVSGSGDSLWYEITMWRDSGWIPADRVRSTWGECG